MIRANLEKKSNTECGSHIPDQAGKKAREQLCIFSFALCQDLPLTPNSAVSLTKLSSPKLTNELV